MENNKYIYNNEAIGVVAIGSLVKNVKHIEISKLLLILPFLTHKETVAFLKNENTVVRSLSEFIAKKPEYISNFNNRYLSLVPISINSLFMLVEMKIVKLSLGRVVYNENSNFSFDNQSLGTRARNMVKASEKLSKILQEDVSSLYLQLRIVI